MNYYPSLTQRESEIADLVAFGMSNKEIARQLGIRHQTVRNMLVHVFRKAAVRKRTQLAVRLVLAEYASSASTHYSREEI
jgi:DNA-binding NarL/FixJ family response regulator